MPVTLRDYQQSIIAEARGALRSYRSVLLQSPTGSGKTQIASFISGSAESKGGFVFFICHRAELITQTSKTFAKAGIKHGIIASQYPKSYSTKVQICSIDTLKNRLDDVPSPSVIIWDEAHHIAAAGWTKVMHRFPAAVHIGLSATPERLDGKGLDSHFDYMVNGPKVSWLIEQGFLSKYKLYAPSVPDMSSVHTRAGDYVRSEIETAMDKSSITGDILKHWYKYSYMKRTIGFAVSVKHSQHMAKVFMDAGIPSVHLDGSTKQNVRQAAAIAFAAGDIMVLWNVDLFGEGYDLAAQADADVTVDCVIQARPTQSLGLHLQQVGRCLRPKEDGSHAVILDHAGNCFRHGLPDDDREWSLGGRDRRSSGKGDDSVPIRQCKECFATHRPAPVCPECGYVYPVVGREVSEVDGELEEVDPKKISMARRKEQAGADSLESLIELAERRGYKNPAKWAGHVWSARMAKKRA